MFSNYIGDGINTVILRLLYMYVMWEKVRVSLIISCVLENKDFHCVRKERQMK